VDTAPPGLSQIGLRDQFTARDGQLYVPASYHASVACPLIVALHGAGGNGFMWTEPAWLQLLDEYNIAMIAPDSRAFDIWDLMGLGAYGPDVAFIDDALAEVFRKVNVDARYIAIAGFSAGASEALGLGVLNGDLFAGVIGFSPSMVFAPFARGRPRAFVSHGTTDTVLPFATSRDTIVPAIKALGVPVEFSQFTGGHSIPLSVARAALRYALNLK
jgi:phospholipase/carboxylesterase